MGHQMSFGMSERCRKGMSGDDYSDYVAQYIANLGPFHVEREKPLGRTIYGSRRSIDVFVTTDSHALAIECKYQAVSGTADEKIPYAQANMELLEPLPYIICYGGSGWRDGAIAYMNLKSTSVRFDIGHHTELDHALARHFGIWDIVSDGRVVSPNPGAHFERK